jgi:cellulose synthase/poly-beta-1,6-N-acetylglucosamine synthase-like glycosyltransferase
MQLFFEFLLILTALALLIPSVTLFIECSASLLPSCPESEGLEKKLSRLVVLIPAHNEAVGISMTLETLLPQIAAPTDILVVADNCTDATASVARTFGVTVIERQDSERIGKGYALDYGIRFLEKNPPDIVIVVDADCLVDWGTIERLERMALTSGKPIQATYLLTQSANPSTKDLLSALAFLVKNLVRPRGLVRMGLPCLLVGTGMAFPWSIIRCASLASSNIVEDMQLGIDLAITGYSPRFCSEAKVTGILPQQQQAAKTQRTRWEHGHLQTLLTQVPRLLYESLRQRRLELFALSLELSIPPLSLLVMLWGLGMGCALLAVALGGSWIPLLILAIAGLLIMASIIGSWARFGRVNIPGSALFTIPFYLLWKLPLYFAFLVRRERKWVRTERNPAIPESSSSIL